MPVRSSGVSRQRADRGEIYAEEATGSVPALFKRRAENDALIRGYGEPCVLREFVFELTGAPAGVT